jgi:DNA polymerase III alpha subunit (gram-positive type)
VAHNAEFDARFLAAALKKTSLMSIKNPILDSLKVSRKIMPESPNHKLVTLAKRLRRQINVAFDETALHRALYDCEVLREVFVAILKKRLQPKDFELSNFLRAVEKVHGPSIALKL